jgi:hypothetical protein
MMLSQQMGAYRTEPKEAAPLLSMIAPRSMQQSAPDNSGWVAGSGEITRRLTGAHHVDHAISLFSMGAFRRPPRKMKST